MQAVIQGLQALRGVAHISAVTIAAELGNISSRFESARKLMGYSGVFPSEDSSGKRIQRGGITKSGNAHLRTCPRTAVFRAVLKGHGFSRAVKSRKCVGL
jgi:transposase